MPTTRPAIVSITRRRFLAAGGAAALLAACGSDDNDSSEATPDATDDTTGASGDEGTAQLEPSPISAETPLTAEDFAAIGTCVLLPEQTAGPFPLDEQFDRRDITEGYPGHPMRLGLRVVDNACEPVVGAAVEIWHTDATGDYSAFEDGGGGKDEGSGTTFCRGTQTAGDDGIVEFLTIVPGWYPGRAVHIHLRVHVDGEIVRTSQLYFAADYLESIYTEEPYAEFGSPDTSNESDGIAGDPETEGTLIALSPAETTAGTGTLGLLNLGVDA